MHDFTDTLTLVEDRKKTGEIFLEQIKARYATEDNVLESRQVIAAKAEDMLYHYAGTVLPNGFKAQVVAVSRRAAVRYQAALAEAHEKLVAELEALDPALLALDDDGLAALDARTRSLVMAHPHLDRVRGMEFAAIASKDHNDDEEVRAWSHRADKSTLIDDFKKPFEHKDPRNQSGLAFLCVMSMLLAGFDAPVEQALYLDRGMREPDLLQAIARVNRTAPGKEHGLIVDYYGVTNHLKEALEAYSAEDVAGALTSIKDELPKLADRRRRVLDVFAGRGLDIHENEDDCIHLLEDERIRAEFVGKLRDFLESVDIVMPRPEALAYLGDAQKLGWVNKVAANRYRDSQLNIAGLGQKVRRLIDRYIVAHGIDPTVPPISILDAEFVGALDAHPSTRAKALEMECALRHHIDEHYQEDPIHYQRLSERLEAVLQRLEHNWDELVEALRLITDEERQEAGRDLAGLDPNTQAPFLRLLVDRIGGEVTQARLGELAGCTVEMVEHIRQEIALVDFWQSSQLQDRLEWWIINFLEANDLVPFENRASEAAAADLMQIARHRHTDLTT